MTESDSSTGNLASGSVLLTVTLSAHKLRGQGVSGKGLVEQMVRESLSKEDI